MKDYYYLNITRLEQYSDIKFNDAMALCVIIANSKKHLNKKVEFKRFNDKKTLVNYLRNIERLVDD